MIHDAIPIPGSGTHAPPHPSDGGRGARTWVRVLANYRAPCQRRSALELLVTLVPFVALWGLAYSSLSISYPLAVALAVLNGAFSSGSSRACT